jgi:hypothetical protein
MLNLKSINSFFHKKCPVLARLQKVKFKLKTLEKIQVGSETGSGSETIRKVGSRSENEKKIPDPQY